MKKITGILLLVLAVLIFQACVPGNESYQKGLNAYTEGDYEEAIERYRLAISQGYSDADIYADLALAYYRNRQTDQAGEAIDKALSDAPEDPGVLKKAGRYFELLGEDETALSYYRASVTGDYNELSRNDLETLALMAGIERKNENYTEAIYYYDLLIVQEYYKEEHTLLAGICYAKQNQILAAQAYFDALSDMENVKAEYYLEAYDALKEAGAFQEASEYYEAGLCLTRFSGEEDGERQKSGTDERMSIGEYLLRTGHTDELEMMEVHEGDTATFLARAKVKIDKRDLSGAEEEFKNVFSVMESDSVISRGDVYAAYFVLKILESDQDGAKQILRYIQNCDDQEILRDALWNESILYENLYDYDTAAEKLNLYLLSYPDDEDAQNELRFLKRGI